MPHTVPHLHRQDASSSSTIHSSRQHLHAVSTSARREALPLRLLKLWHLTSLDAPTVAVVWTLGFAWAAGVRMAVWVPPLLALTVWAVYVCDRLLDARAALRAAELSRLRERHYFHWRHRRVLLPAAVVAACAATGLILACMPVDARERDSVLATASLLYFARVHSGHRINLFHCSVLSKELLVGVLFTCGCALPVFGALLSSNIAIWPLVGVAAFFAPLAWLNCHAIDKWETGKTAAPHTRMRFHLSSGLASAPVLAVAGALLALSVSFFDARAGALLASGAASALSLALLDVHNEKLSPVILRSAADLALLAPALILGAVWLTR